MKKTVLIILALVALATIAFSQTYNNPESVAWDDLGKRYFISNKAGNSIVQLNALNQLTNFVTSGLKNPKGLLIVGDTLISVNNTNVQGFLLSDAKQVFNIAITGSIWMNDVTTDKKGNIYVSDSETNKIHKISLKTGEYSTLTTIESGPNGLFFDAQTNSLFICNSGNNAKIFSYDLSSSTIKTIISTKFSDLDGLARDNCGNLYVSSWGSNSVYVYDSSFKNPPTTVSKGNNGPADISINEKEQILAIPNFLANTISQINLNIGCGKITNSIPLKNSVIVFRDSLLIDWEDIAGVTNYELEYSADSTFSASVVIVKSSTSKSYLKGLTSNTKYYWRVRPSNGNEKSIFNVAWNFTPTIANTTVIAQFTRNICKVSPNPSTGIFNINIGDSSVKNAKVEIYDFSGKIMLSKELDNGIIDLTSNKKGIYVAKISIGDKVICEKLVLK